MIVALALRASDLRADAHLDQRDGLVWSFGSYTDEGLDSYSARNMYLYGSWRVDDLFPLVVYPLVNYLMVLIFKVFGIGFVQVKLLSLLASVASVFLIYMLVRDDAGPVAGLLAGLAFATCFPLTMYGRLGLVEPVQILFLLLTGLCYVRGLRHPMLMGLAGLLGTSTILLVKASAVFIAPVLVLALAWELLVARKDRACLRIMLRSVAWGLAGVVCASGIWLAIVLLPHRAEYFEYVLRHSLESPAGHPRGIVAYLLNTFTVGYWTGLIPRLPWVAGIGFITLPLLSTGRRPALRYLSLWLVLGLLMLGYMNYRPDRYELVLLPALVAGFAVASARILEAGTLLPQMRPNLVKAGLYVVWLWMLVTQLAFHTQGFWGRLQPRTDPGLLTMTFIIAAVAGMICYGIARIFRRGVAARPLVVRLALTLLILTLTVRLDLMQYFRWFGTRTHAMVESGSDLDRHLPRDAVLAGNWAPALLIGSGRRVVALTDWANVDDPVGRFGATHLVSVVNGFDLKLFIRLYPDLMERASIFRQYEVGGTQLLICELPKPDRQPPLPNPGP
jgi:4-amino-4-deoxy-L-arabinose transferase-like glycosyltransferase